MEQTAAGRRCVAKGWIHASKVPIGSALRPRIHSASGGAEASSGNPRMAVAARAVQYCAFHRARRAGSGTAGRTPAPLFALTPLIGANALCFGSAVIEPPHDNARPQPGTPRILPAVRLVTANIKS